MAGSLTDSNAGNEAEIIKAISHVELDMAGSLWRFDTVLGDMLNDDNQFIQVYVENNALVEATRYTRLTSFTPAPEDLTAWYGDAEGGLGDKVYTLWREQLGSVGYSPSELQAAMGDAEQLDYTRDADPGKSFIPPFNGTQTRIESASGDKGSFAKIWMMPYVRKLTDGTPEYLLIQLSKVESTNGDTHKQGVFVQMWIGIQIEKERITIQ
jgi:hypothetical protein